jgi:hypothetical protein
MAPPGTKIISHSKPANHSSSAPYGAPGWYILPALEHYCCYQVYITKTNTTRISDTVEFFPSKTTLPAVSSANTAHHVARDLIQALINLHPSAPFLPFGDAKINALEQLAKIFHLAAPRVAAQPLRVNAASPKTTPFQANKLWHIPSQTTPNTPLDKLFEKPDYLTMNLFANAVIDPLTGISMEHHALINNPATREDWLHSAANEFRRCAQGIGNRIKGTNTITFIRKADVPSDRKVTYARFVCSL